MNQQNNRIFICRNAIGPYLSYGFFIFLSFRILKNNMSGFSVHLNKIERTRITYYRTVIICFDIMKKTGEGRDINSILNNTDLKKTEIYKINNKYSFLIIAMRL